jgi:hypothetical protein
MNLTALIVVTSLLSCAYAQYANYTVNTRVTVLLQQNQQTKFVVSVPPQYRSYVSVTLQEKDISAVVMYQSRNYIGNSTVFDNKLAQPNNSTSLVLTLEPSLTTNAIYFAATYTGPDANTTLSFILQLQDVLVFHPSFGTIRVDLNGDYAYYKYTPLGCEGGRYVASASCPDTIELGINAVDFRSMDSIPIISKNPSVEMSNSEKAGQVFVRLRAAPGSCTVGVNCGQVTMTVTEYCPTKPNPGAIIGGIVGALGVIFLLIIPGIIIILMYYGVIKTPDAVVHLIRHIKAQQRQKRIDAVQAEPIQTYDETTE